MRSHNEDMLNSLPNGLAKPHFKSNGYDIRFPISRLDLQLWLLPYYAGHGDLESFKSLIGDRYALLDNECVQYEIYHTKSEAFSKWLGEIRPQIDIARKSDALIFGSIDDDANEKPPTLGSILREEPGIYHVPHGCLVGSINFPMDRLEYRQIFISSFIKRGNLDKLKEYIREHAIPLTAVYRPKYLQRVAKLGYADITKWLLKISDIPSDERQAAYDIAFKNERIDVAELLDPKKSVNTGSESPKILCPHAIFFAPAANSKAGETRNVKFDPNG